MKLPPAMLVLVLDQSDGDSGSCMARFFSHTIKSVWYWKREEHKLQQCNICEQGETDKENVLKKTVMTGPLPKNKKLGTHINAHIARKNTNTQP
jgi:hypothetical protein